MGGTTNDPRRGDDGGSGRALNRQDQDGLTGAGDMLGGLSTGAGGRLGVDIGDAHPVEGDPDFGGGHRHEREQGGFEIDGISDVDSNDHRSPDHYSTEGV